MIPEMVIRADIDDALEYGNKSGIQLMVGGVDLPGHSLPEIAESFRRTFSLNPRVSRDKIVVHVYVRLDPRDRQLDTAGWLYVWARITAALGIDRGPTAAFLHHDIEDAEHLHGFGSMVDGSGRRVDMGGNYWRLSKVCRQLEKELGLYQLPSIRGGKISPPIPPEKSMIPTLPPVASMPVPGVMEFARAAMHQVLRPGITLPELKMGLKALPVPVDLAVKFSRTGDKIDGLGFRLEGTYVKASDVDRTFSLSGLMKTHGVIYEPMIHLPMLSPPGPPIPSLLPPPGRIAFPELPDYLPEPAGLPRPGRSLPGAGEVSPQLPMPDFLPDPADPPPPGHFLFHPGELPPPPHIEVPRVEPLKSRFAQAFATFGRTIRDWFLPPPPTPGNLLPSPGKQHTAPNGIRWTE